MPSGKNWFNFLYINLAFAIYAAVVFYYGQVSEIKSKWPLYRFNPIYMPLADDIQSNFIYCIHDATFLELDALLLSHLLH